MVGLRDDGIVEVGHRCGSCLRESPASETGARGFNRGIRRVAIRVGALSSSTRFIPAVDHWFRHVHRISHDNAPD